MVRKKVDSRVRTLIENGVKLNHRSLIVLVGDHGKDQVVNLHYVLSKTRVAARPSVLWCYKKELGFSTHKQKRMRQLKRQKKAGLSNAAEGDDPFELFMNSTNIRWCYYKDTSKVLGCTFGMCVLQDFEALTPNLLARTIETVEGGGLVVLLLKTVSSLQQLYTMTMDVHDRFRTEGYGDAVGRFTERFMLTLGDCRNCLICDDELNILPLSSHMKSIKPITATLEAEEEEETSTAKELRLLKESLEGTPPIGQLVSGAKTIDQARALLTFMDAISEKTLRSTVALTAARGRGKSAAIGFCLAGAVSYGYSNIFVTAPAPENLGTMFEFVLKGFDLIGLKEHLDYDVIQSTDKAYNNSIVRINIFKDHRQTIQYIQPQDSSKLSHCELLAIDEAAAIPLPVVKQLLGPYLTFMSSTINGYEGTGRSLSLKLLDQLRKQQGTSAAAAAANAAAAIHGSGKKKGKEQVHEQRWKIASEAATNSAYKTAGGGLGRSLREISLSTPIRYGDNDPIEKWLNQLLCLDTVSNSFRLVCGTPAPQDCELYHVNRDALFSYHKLSEAFLQRVMSLYTAAHYKNQPNDLQLLSDAPAHHLFVLLGPKALEQGAGGKLPDVLCVVQVALEGKISRASVQASMARGHRASGDLIPWTLSQQFQDSRFPSLSGARIVRVATHPDVQKMGYGTRALKILASYYQGDIVELGVTGGEKGGKSGDDDEEEGEEEESDDDDDDDNNDDDDDDDEEEEEEEEEKGNGETRNGKGSSDKSSSSKLNKERLKPRKKMPPLLEQLTQRPPERLHWLGVSYGLTGQLLRFWQRLGMQVCYLRQTTNELTGEHTSIMLKSLNCEDLEDAPQADWVDAYMHDCRNRLTTLMGFEFQGFDVTTGVTLLGGGGKAASFATATTGSSGAVMPALSAEELSYLMSPHDLKRLDLYSRNMVDYHLVTDLIPTLAKLHFMGRVPTVSMSYLQAAIVLGIGIQHKSVDKLTEELQIPDNQVLALFNKAVRKLCNCLNDIQKSAIEKEEEGDGTAQARQAARKQADAGMKALAGRMDDELEAGAKQELQKLHKPAKAGVLNDLDIAQYAIKGTDADWQQALSGMSDKATGDITGVSIKGEKVAWPKKKEGKGHKKGEGEGADSDGAGGGGGGGGKEKSGKKKRKRKGGEEDGVDAVGGSGGGWEDGGGKKKKKDKKKAKKEKD